MNDISDRELTERGGAFAINDRLPGRGENVGTVLGSIGCILSLVTACFLLGDPKPAYCQMDPPNYILEWGGFADVGDSATLNPGKFKFAYLNHGIVVGDDQLIYVSDTGNGRIQVFNKVGQFMRLFGRPSSQFNQPPGTFADPSGLTFAAGGNLLVADTGNWRVQELTRTGEFVRLWGNTGSYDEELGTPRAIVTGADGDIYVSGVNRITRFAEGLEFIGWWTGGGNDLAFDSLGRLYAQTLLGVARYNADGFFIDSWGQRGSVDGMSERVAGMTIDAQDRVYLTDCDRHRVQVFTLDGQFLTNWGTFGSGLGEFNCPTGVVVDGDGSIYVVDTWNHRIQKFAFPSQLEIVSGVQSHTILPPSPNPSSGPVDLWVEIGASGETNGFHELEVQVFDVTGRQVRSLVSRGVDLGVQRIRWDGSSDESGPVPGGLYFARIIVDGQNVGTERILRLR